LSGDAAKEGERGHWMEQGFVGRHHRAREDLPGSDCGGASDMVAKDARAGTCPTTAGAPRRGKGPTLRLWTAACSTKRLGGTQRRSSRRVVAACVTWPQPPFAARISDDEGVGSRAKKSQGTGRGRRSPGGAPGVAICRPRMALTRLKRASPRARNSSLATRS
jgi:hypothetical protein